MMRWCTADAVQLWLAALSNNKFNIKEDENVEISLMAAEKSGLEHSSVHVGWSGVRKRVRSGISSIGHSAAYVSDGLSHDGYDERT
jgi:hypothetical protein